VVRVVGEDVSEVLNFIAARLRDRAAHKVLSAQKVSASDAPIAMPSTSRRRSVLTATAMVTATETMRLASRSRPYLVRLLNLLVLRVTG
jgi:hypothetical protein